MDYTDEVISKIASRIAAVTVEYTTRNSPQHVFKKGGDTIKVYDNPKLNKRFNVVLAGKDFSDGPYNTILRMGENGSSSFSTGKDDPSLGQPVVWNSLPASLKSVILNNVKGKYEE